MNKLFQPDKNQKLSLDRRPAFVFLIALCVDVQVFLHCSKFLKLSKASCELSNGLALFYKINLK